ncbi:MAG TPA: polysaccharide biosynthesis/export family protein [Longimicrobiaceae bacterium]
MRRMIGLLLAIATLLPIRIGAQEATRVEATGAPPAVLQPGDAVRIVVWRKPELSGEFQIAADGHIGSPFYMEINVAGVPLDEVAELVRSHVSVYQQEPRVFVEPLLQVSVGGEVRNPSLYRLPPETTIAEAVMNAGGPTERGHVTQVVLWRGGQQHTVDLTRPEEGLAGQPIRSGDQIMMPRKVSILRDYIAPFGSIIGAAAAVANIMLRKW